MILDSSDAEIEVIQDRLSERSDLKFDENTRNSISSETSSFEVIKTPRNDDIIPMNKPITTTLSPSKDKPASSTPRGSKEFPNLAVKFPIQQPELPKSCGWKQERFLQMTQIKNHTVKISEPYCTIRSVGIAPYESYSMIHTI